jgi:hypothetical protein
MSKRKPFDPKKLSVGDIVEWVEYPDVWDVEVLEIKDYGIIVDAGYGKKALFGPSSEGDGKYVHLVGTMEMDDYLRHLKKKNKKKDKKKHKKVSKRELIDPEKLSVGDVVELVDPQNIWDVEILDITPHGIIVSCSWDKALFVLSSKGDGRYVLFTGEGENKKEYLRYPKKKDKQ